MQHEDARKLLNRYLEDKCSRRKSIIRKLPEIPQSIKDEQLAAVWESLPVHHSKKSIQSLWPYISIASMLLIVFSGLYFYSSRERVSDQYVKNQIIPGGNKAILTLSDGQRISLTEVQNGEIAEQAGIKILKTADGQLIYSAVHSKPDNPASFNTIETPKGGQYQVTLPDGTEVKGS